MSKVEYLLLSNSHDFTTDYIALGLEKRQAPYLRIDRDLLSSYKVHWNINTSQLFIDTGDQNYCINASQLRSIYYRAPTYLRETFSKSRSPEQELERSQWMAFFRNFELFETAKWVNRPTATFHAENKAVQLKAAQKVGLPIPQTIITNSQAKLPNRRELVVKSIDTALVNFGEEEGFLYTNILDKEELERAELSVAPIFVQEHLFPKIDYRVTIVGKTVFSAKILVEEQGIRGDWRRKKLDAQFINSTLPRAVKNKCLRIVQDLGLLYGAIDLALYNEDFYFIEINPTGEWAWLLSAANQRIDEAICNLLTQ